MLNPLFLNASAVKQHAIMSGVRGPDDLALSRAKDIYTTPIRCWLNQCAPEDLFQLGAGSGDAAPGDAAGWLALYAKLQNELSDDYNHYYSHLLTAINAIEGLETAKAR